MSGMKMNFYRTKIFLKSSITGFSIAHGVVLIFAAYLMVLLLTGRIVEVVFKFIHVLINS